MTFFSLQVMMRRSVQKQEQVIILSLGSRFTLGMHLRTGSVRLIKQAAIALGLLIGISLPSLLRAQFYNGSQMTFGKNRVQYGEFLWSYFRFDEFETYFYLNGKELAIFTAEYARMQIPRMQARLETSLGEKIQFIIYNNLSDLKQSNIGLISDQQYNTGGVTHIIGNKVILYFDGDHKSFERQIRYGIANVLLNEMLYGGSLTSQVTNATLLTLPDWYLQGLISYLADDWNTTIDNFVRDGIISGRYLKYNRLTGEDARYAGHALWKYIEIQYGAQTIPNIIYMTKVSKNVESGFLYVLGTSYKNLIREWRLYYDMKYTDLDGVAESPEKIFSGMKYKPEKTITHARISPDGRFLAYTTNEMGRYTVWLYDQQKERSNRIFRGGYKLDEKTDYSYPLLAWHPAGHTLAFILESKGGIWLHYFEPENRQHSRMPLFRLEKIVDFSYAPDGRTFVISGVQQGQSDLFIYNIAARTLDQITKDVYDDLQPRYMDNGRQIIFASNRPDDTLRFESIPNMRETSRNRDLFLYNLSGKGQVLRRLTQTQSSDEIMPRPYPNGQFSFLSDENGIYNRYIGRLDSTISRIDTTIHYRYFTSVNAVSNMDRSILEYDISTSDGQEVRIIYQDGRYMMSLENKDFPEKGLSKALPLTEFRQKLPADTLAPDQEEVQEIPETPQVKQRFQTVREGEPLPVKPVPVDINNYTFDKQAFISLNSTGQDTSGGRALLRPERPPLTIPKQLNYNVGYTINELVSQVDFSFLNSNYQAFSGTGQPIFLNPGLNALLQVGAMDLLEDYRITGGVRLSASLNNNEYLISFSNLRKRLDKEMIFHRQSIEEEVSSPIYALVRHNLHEFHYVLRWPFSPVASLRGSAILRNDRAVFLSLGEQSLSEPDQVRNWTGLKAEYVYDASREFGLNLYYGMRAKAFAEYYRQIEVARSNIVILGFDMRHSTRIHRTFIWVNRLAASTSMGDNKLIYYMGGVDNWLFPKFNQGTRIDKSQPYVYQTLATNMRGFDQNIRNGNSFFLINSEFRMPLFRYLANRPIKSDFLNNFQIVGFGDFGTAWNGLDPYARSNSLFTRIISQGPLTITIEEQKDPLVGGMGFGLRSRILGYFLRADWAWGIEDRSIQKAKFYLSLSLDI